MADTTFTNGVTLTDAAWFQDVNNFTYRGIVASQLTTALKFTAGLNNIASAATVNLSTATSNTAHITGTTGISAVTMTSGQVIDLVFDGALTLTHHATNNNLPGAASITTAAGDRARYWYDGTTVWCVGYQKANGQAVVSAGGITLGTSVASTSGTSIDFTSIPAGTKRISINFNGVSVSGTSNPLFQLGDAGGIETSGYLGAGSDLSVGANFTTGFGIPSGVAANVLHGTIVLTLMNAATFTWSAFGIFAQSNTTTVNQVAGNKSLSAPLDRVRITTVGGTDTFDAGTINITYELSLIHISEPTRPCH
jgi:hypothetical protein